MALNCWLFPTGAVSVAGVKVIETSVGELAPEAFVAVRPRRAIHMKTMSQGCALASRLRELRICVFMKRG
jgi:hypothetical protein